MAIGGLLGGLSTKTVVLATAGTLVVAGAAIGVGTYVFAPKVTVVARSASVEVPAGGEQSAMAACLGHETAINGGFAVGGDAVPTRSMFVGTSAWLASAYNSGGTPVTLTAYAVCVNARVEVEGGLAWTKAYAYRDRRDKVGAAPTDLIKKAPFATLNRDGVGIAHCAGRMIGMEFRADRAAAGRPVRPVPPQGAWIDPARAWVRLNPGTILSHELVELTDLWNRRTLVLESKQQPTHNYAVSLRPVCVTLPDVSIVEVTSDVPVGSSASAAVRCPKGRHAVGGGFDFPEPPGDQVRFYEDGFLYASTSAPSPGDPSGKPVTGWRATGVNQERADTHYQNSVWHHLNDEDGEISTTSLGFMGDPSKAALAAPARTYPVPDHEAFKVRAACAKIDLEPTTPVDTTPVVARPDLVPAIDLPSIAPPASPSASASPKPSPSGSASPKPSPSLSPSPKPSASAARPSVTVTKPVNGDQLCYGPNQFAGTARTRPANRMITDPHYLMWEIVTPSGRFPLGNGAAGTFEISPNQVPPDNNTVVFTATDPTSGLKTSVETAVWVVGC